MCKTGGVLDRSSVGQEQIGQPWLVPLVDREASDALMSWQLRFALRSGEPMPLSRPGHEAERMRKT